MQGECFINLSSSKDFYLYDTHKKGFSEIVDVYNLIKYALLVIGTRYHILVMALGAKTPVVNTVKVICGDYRYYYKNFGILYLVFQNQIFDPKGLLFYDQQETFTHVLKKFKTIIKNQETMFNHNYNGSFSLLSYSCKTILMNLSPNNSELK